MKLLAVIAILIFQTTTFAQKTVDLSAAKYCENKQMLGLMSADDNTQKSDRIVVQKKYKKMYLMSEGRIIKSYDIAMGPGAELGAKSFQGDQKTPEGIYEVEFKNPKSNYYMALKVSYPNALDLAYAKSQKKHAGDSIMIHGFPVKAIDGLHPQVVKESQHPRINWTRGCMAVTDREIEEIYSLVAEKTQIEICPI